MLTEQRRIVFFDTETTELRDDREIWEYGLIVREPGKADREFQAIITDVDMSWANPVSLRIGGAYERHPFLNRTKLAPGVTYLEQRQAAQILEAETRGAIIVGAVPDFDTSGAKNLLRRNGLPWSGHYHLVDIENLVVGYLRARFLGGATDKDPGLPPWSSDELSRMVGVEPPGPDQRHTALGDARWVRDQWDVIMPRE
jgi:hypothetical protein